MTKVRVGFAGLAVVAAVAGLLLVGSVWAGEGDFACTPKVTMDDTGTAELAAFSCFFKKWEGADVVHFKVAVKNVSDAPRRYKVHIFLDNGKAVGGLIPRKTQKGLVPPGGTADFVYPVKGMTEKPGEIVLRIAAMDP